MVKRVKRFESKDELTNEDIIKMMNEGVNQGILGSCFMDGEPKFIESRRIRIKCNHCGKIVNWDYKLDYDKDLQDGKK